MTVGAGGFSQPGAPGRLSALTVNLRFGLAQDGPDSWPLRRRSVRRLLKRYTADFMVFQEVNDFQADALARDLPSHRCIGLRRPAPRFWQNNLIFYHRRWQCRRKHHFYLSPTPDIPSRSRESRWPRQCTLGAFVRPPFEIGCVTTHFDFSSAVQVAAARRVRREVDAKLGGLPVLLMGDFNAGPDSPCRRELSSPTPIPDGCRFRSVFTPPYPGTHHGFSGQSTGEQIDWILHSGKIQATGCRVVAQPFDRRYPSDHFPLYAEFALPS
jgi:endonuclease/exonuclease/phosphatase family metal-dependent hydrolase